MYSLFHRRTNASDYFYVAIKIENLGMAILLWTLIFSALHYPSN